MNENRIQVSRTIGRGELKQDWLFPIQKEGFPETTSEPTDSSFTALVNGEEAFGALYDAILNAKETVDIAIWGFQPSMFFKRGNKVDTYSCIGNLLIELALKGVEVKILVWSMFANVQTFKEGNLGNMPDMLSTSLNKLINNIPAVTASPGVTEVQKDYDYWWYKTVMGEATEQEINAQMSKLQYNDTTWQRAFANLQRFMKLDDKRWEKLQYKTRSVTMASRPLGINSRDLTLFISASHHQKSVLIDYADPDNAVGFVLEHNMLDNYWDTNAHSQKRFDDPRQGKNYWGNYQDVSSMVTGGVLWDLNYNFCQSWDRESNSMLPSYWNSVAKQAYETKLTGSSSRHHNRRVFKPKDEIVKAQILRTYDEPVVRDIKQMYLTNITKVSSYLYTENQYFRWKELVEEFKQHWENCRTYREPQQPIHWFVVTNSSDEALTNGSYHTNEMFAALGRQDVMPTVAKIENKDTSDFERNIEFEKELESLEQHIKDATDENQYQELMSKRHELILEEEKRQTQQTNRLRQDLSQSIGIKSHICTLVSTDSETWNEVYIHSKVTIMDDIFTFIGSANLNKRSMEADTELGIIVENPNVAKDLRQRLWGLHTGNDGKANPSDMNDPQVAKDVFIKWEKLLNRNKALKLANKLPEFSLCEFLRYSPHIGSKD